MNTCRMRITCIAVSLFLCMASHGFCQEQDFDKVQIQTVHVAGNVYMLIGSGGNIGVCAGDDGVFMVDDQFAPLTKKIRAAIAKISDKDIRFLINTHWHYDHVGGNENIGEAGSVIIAHKNVRTRMGTDQFIDFFQKTIPASPASALPIITFTKDITFHVNNENIEVFHVKTAHTDGDAIIYFKNADVLHTGDIYFAGIYPFIDVSSNGSVAGVIDAATYVLSIINDKTKVIPGHGPLSNKAELKAYVEMLSFLKDNITKSISEGKTFKEIQGSRPTQQFDTTWGGGFLSPDQFVQILYSDLSRKCK